MSISCLFIRICVVGGVVSLDIGTPQVVRESELSFTISVSLVSGVVDPLATLEVDLIETTLKLNGNLGEL